MGIKAFKENYGLDKGVTQVRDGHICHGSYYVPDMIKVSLDGQWVIDAKSLWVNGDKELEALRDKLFEDKKSGKLKEIWEKKEDCAELNIVYTYKGGRVVKKYAEEFGWPNVCTDGEMMYDNTHFKTYKEAKDKLLIETSAGVYLCSGTLKEKLIDLKNYFYGVFIKKIMNWVIARVIK